MAKKERKLTAKELERKARFEQRKKELETQGYRTKELTMGVVVANLLAFVVMLPFALLYICLFMWVNSFQFQQITDFWMFAFFPLLLLLTVIHEGIHGLTWGFFAKNHMKSIDYGIIWSMLTPYCTCSESLEKIPYLLGSAMPTIVLGFIFGLICIMTNAYFPFLLSLLMIFGGGGDALVILKILMYKTSGKDGLYQDHPYDLGVVVFEKE